MMLASCRFTVEEIGMNDRYILEGKTPVKEPDLWRWAKWFEGANRKVAETEGKVSAHGKNVGIVRISTVFLGLDHSFGEGAPMLFETMVFGGALDGEQDRCSTWEAAEKMHALMVEKVRHATES